MAKKKYSPCFKKLIKKTGSKKKALKKLHTIKYYEAHPKKRKRK